MRRFHVDFMIESVSCDARDVDEAKLEAKRIMRDAVEDWDNYEVSEVSHGCS